MSTEETRKEQERAAQKKYRVNPNSSQVAEEHTEGYLSQEAEKYKKLKVIRR